MKLICESEKLNDYLIELPEVNYSHPLIIHTITHLFDETQKETEKVKMAFEFVRDQISHSWDIKGQHVTCSASEVLTYKEGICYAKSNLLAALLRSQGIPTGFCYQRLLLFDHKESVYCIHALNAVFLQSLNKWIKLDARGNKEGVDAQFSVVEEKIAFLVNEENGEVNYPTIYTRPNVKTMEVLKQHTNPILMYTLNLPDELE